MSLRDYQIKAIEQLDGIKRAVFVLLPAGAKPLSQRD